VLGFYAGTDSILINIPEKLPVTIQLASDGVKDTSTTHSLVKTPNGTIQRKEYYLPSKFDFKAGDMPRQHN
jgi:hypothetical protein